MTPVIVYGGDRASRTKKIEERYDLEHYALTKVEAAERSILIEQIHELVRSLGVAAHLPRLVWIEEADKLTVAAQNALLKLLEEPPANTTILLSCTNHRSLLPTILSRCTVSKVEPTDSPNVDGSCLAVIKQAMAMKAGDRIALADSLGRKREVLIDWVNQCLAEIESKIQTESSPERQKLLGTIAALVHTASLDLHANVSTGLTLQNIFLHLPKSK